MPEPRFPYEQGLREFDRVVAAAQRELILTVRLAIQTEDLRIRRNQMLQLARVTAVLDQLGAYVDPAARSMVEDAYAQGASRALQQITALGVSADAGGFGGVAAEAIGVLQDSVIAALKDGRARVGRQVQDVYARAGRQAATRAILGAEGSPRTARRALVRDLLKDRQISRMVRDTGAGFIDRANRKWTIERYAQMVVRTVTREAVVQGAVDRMASHGITLARISMHASACAICQPFEGKLIDLTGSGRDFDGEATISGPLPPFHPNCTHNLSPVAVRIERLRREVMA